ncbi:hypothetical protein STCU_10689 [Strigomonas culicis]|uniref:Uncharacterized protein n=1 Tax=Strigomonas culicis TaxID=28005 RepID=S9URS7_9TRYP|nr:hypothetical protein STCU_10689 [Strigomonas culicis]|eukprot:EPY17311.1 hypothetical protein STCU_10689 [Strigomonas culicis]
MRLVLCPLAHPRMQQKVRQGLAKAAGDDELEDERNRLVDLQPRVADGLPVDHVRAAVAMRAVRVAARGRSRDDGEKPSNTGRAERHVALRERGPCRLAIRDGGQDVGQRTAVDRVPTRGTQQALVSRAEGKRQEATAAEPSVRGGFPRADKRVRVLETAVPASQHVDHREHVAGGVLIPLAGQAAHGVGERDRVRQCLFPARAWPAETAQQAVVEGEHRPAHVVRALRVERGQELAARAKLHHAEPIRGYGDRGGVRPGVPTLLRHTVADAAR